MLLNYKKQVDLKLNSICGDLPNLPIYDPIKYIIELGGKRFRSSLLLFVSHMFSNNIERAINEAVAIELFHNFTLIHDDIMDQAPMRRGKSSVHEKWDTNIAILSGDLLYALVNKILASSKFQSKEVQELFHQTAIEVCEGQSLDMAFEKMSNINIDQYIEMIRLKTAVLVACSLKIGAIVGGANTSNANLLYDFGLNLGISFQIHDDILDVYPSNEVFGKLEGGDILEKKKTLLFINLLSKLSLNEQEDLIKLIDNPNMSNVEKVKSVKLLYNKFDVLSFANELKNSFYVKAMESLKNLDTENDLKFKLQEFADNLMNRKF